MLGTEQSLLSASIPRMLMDLLGGGHPNDGDPERLGHLPKTTQLEMYPVRKGEARWAQRDDEWEASVLPADSSPRRGLAGWAPGWRVPRGESPRIPGF